MSAFVLYSGLLLTILWLFYKLILDRQTFFRLNRMFLIGSIIISFIVPLVPVPANWMWHNDFVSIPTEKQPATIIPINDNNSAAVRLNAAGTSDEFFKSEKYSYFKSQPVKRILLTIYICGVCIMLLSMILQLAKLYLKTKRSPFREEGNYRIYEIEDDEPACSFANNIFINPQKYDRSTYDQILLHEKIHARQLHSIDLLLSELVLAFQWFNPFVWLYRRSVGTNLEFLTDDLMLKDESVYCDNYQMTLLKVSVPSFPLAITSNYNQSFLKARINMMNAKRSSSHSIWKYFFVLPVIWLAVCTFGRPVVIGQQPKIFRELPITNKSVQVNNSAIDGVWLAIQKGDTISIDFKPSSGASPATTSFTKDEIANYEQGVATGKFNLVRNAGTITFKGNFDQVGGVGNFTFIVNSQFQSFLASSGFKDITIQKMFLFCLANINKDYVSDIQQFINDNTINSRTSGFLADDLFQFKLNHIDKKFLDGLKEANCKGMTPEEVVMLRFANVDPSFIKEMKSLGYGDLPADRFIGFKASGINGDYIRGFNNLGFQNIPVGVLMLCKMKDITPQFVNSMIKKGIVLDQLDKYIQLNNNKSDMQ